MMRMVPTVGRSTPDTEPVTANRRMAPTAATKIEAPMVTMGEYMPRFWIYMQVLLVLCVVASIVIAAIKL